MMVSVKFKQTKFILEEESLSFMEIDASKTHESIMVTTSDSNGNEIKVLFSFHKEMLEDLKNAFDV